MFFAKLVRKRTVCVVLGFAVAVLVAFVVIRALYPQGYGITKDAYDRIESRMTFEEVRDLIGLDPGEYQAPTVEMYSLPYPPRKGYLYSNLPRDRPIAYWQKWSDDAAAIFVGFDKENRVVDKEFRVTRWRNVHPLLRWFHVRVLGSKE